VGATTYPIYIGVLALAINTVVTLLLSAVFLARHASTAQTAASN
jgi:SSS family solute:Na+ symporter